MTPSEKILQKTLVTSGLNSAQWNQVQAGLRDRAFFSSRVESARFLHAAKSQIGDLADGHRSASEIRRDLRALADAEGYTPEAGDEGTIKDLRSRQRLDVIIQTNARQARGYMQQLEGNTPGALAAFPAQELIRTRARKVPREWDQRWRGQGGRLYASRMIALKGDPVWHKISAFGVPWPPFDFGSGMGVQDIDRAEAIALGIIQPDDPPPPPANIPGFNDNLEASVPFTGADDPEWLWLKGCFGDQIVYKGRQVKWQAQLIKDVLSAPDPAAGAVVRLGKAQSGLRAKAPEALKDLLANTSLSLPENWLRHLSDHIGENETDPRNNPLQPGDFDLLPTLWRNPDRVKIGDYNKSALLELDTFDGNTLELVIDLRSGAMPKTLYKKKRNP